MTLSPFEVERQEFGRGAFGYRRREVDSFLDEVRTTLVGLWQERADLREENERLTERVARFTALEEQLKNTLLLAQDSAEKATEQARREGELLMREAGQKAREIVHQSHEERQRLELALRELQSAEQETRARFRALAQTVVSHLDDSEASATESVATLTAVVHNTGELRITRREAAATKAAAEAATPPGERPRTARAAAAAARADGMTPPPARSRADAISNGEIGRPPSFDSSSVAPRAERDAGRTSPREAAEAAAAEAGRAPVGTPG